MYTGATIFSQLMQQLPWYHFHRCVKRYRGNYKVKAFKCADYFRVLAFAQLTYRESLRDFKRLHEIHTLQAFFVTRAKANLKFRRRYSRPVDRTLGLICDQTVLLSSFYPLKAYPEPLRRIKFHDPEPGNRSTQFYRS